MKRDSKGHSSPVREEIKRVSDMMENNKPAPSNPFSGLDSLDLLLVNPSVNWRSENILKMTLRIEEDIPNQESPPLGLGYLLAAARKEGLKAKCIDMAVDGYSISELVDLIAKTKPSLVGFTAFTKQITEVGEISLQIKKSLPNTLIGVGGCHVTAIPFQTLEEFPQVDFVFCGEGEEQVKKILDLHDKPESLAQVPGVVTRNTVSYEHVIAADLDNAPFPAWEEFDLAKYPGLLPHQTKLELPMLMTRGCPFKCTFCCRVNGGEIRFRSVKSVLAEIERNVSEFGCEALAVCDENFVVDKEWTKQMLSGLIDSGLNKKVKWSAAMRVNTAQPDLLKRMKEAGCYYVFYGFESANDATLGRVNKGTRVSQMLPAVQWTKEAGLVPVGGFMIGLPGDTDKEVFEAIELGKKLDLYSITFPIAVPYPGTEMREQALKNMYGMRILTSEWNMYGRKSIDSKEDFEIMESESFPAEHQRKMQAIAYEQHPKKKMDEYLKQLDSSTIK